MHIYRIILLATFLLMTAGALRAELPPDAQTAMEKGVLAAQQQDFPLAAKFFAEAREFAPEAPELLYNLGLAESKIPGRELRAIAWFGAYLAAHPSAPNAAAVKKQMGALDVTNQVNVARLLKAVAEAANIVPEPDRSEPGGLIQPGMYAVGGSLQEAAVLMARTGNATDALRLAAGIKDGYWRSQAQGNIGLALGKAGDTRGAGKCYSLAMKTRPTLSVELAAAQAQAGEIAAALKTADTEPWGRWSIFANSAIAKAMIAQGNLPGAKALLAKVEREANAMPNDKGDVNSKSASYLDLGVALAQAGDFARARQAYDHVKVDFWKEEILAAIVRAQANAGEFTSAQKTAEQLTGYHKEHAPSDITAAKLQLQAKSGDLAGAVQAAGQLAKDKDDALKSLANFQAASGDLAGALQIVALIDERYSYRRLARMKVIRVQSKSQLASPARNWIAVNTDLLDDPNYSDFPAALANLPKNSAKEAFTAMHDFAESVLDLRELITRMMKLQSPSPPKS